MIKATLLGIYFVLLTAIGFAEEPTYIPNFFNDPSPSSIETLVWGRACFSMPAGPLGLSCNPAFLAGEDKQHFRIDINFDNGAGDVVDYNQSLHNKDEFGIINQAIDQKEAIAGRAATPMWYQRDWWAIKWTPYRASAALRARTPAYPEISTHLQRDSEWMAQTGFYLADNKSFQVGFQARYVRREYIRGNIDLLNAISNPDLVAILDSRVIYFEPGIAYTFEHSLQPRISAMINNVEIYKSGDSMNTKTIVDLGFSTTPRAWSDRVTSTVHYSSRSEIDRVADRFSVATNVAFDREVMFQVGVGALTQGVSIMGHIDSAVLGFGYQVEDIAPESWKTDRQQQTLFEFGLVF